MLVFISPEEMEQLIANYEAGFSFDRCDLDGTITLYDMGSRVVANTPVADHKLVYGVARQGYILIMYNEIDWCRIKNCPFDERNKLVTYIDELIELKHDFEKDGILCFENYSKSSTDMFEKVALTFIAQGYMPGLCRTMLYNLIFSSELEPSTYLKHVIFAEFVLMLQKGETSDYMIKMFLLSYLGIAFADEFLK